MRTLMVIACLSIFAALYSQENNVMRDSRDEKEYRTVHIRRQIWMAENLAYDAKFDVDANQKHVKQPEYFIDSINNPQKHEFFIIGRGR